MIALRNDTLTAGLGQYYYTVYVLRMITIKRAIVNVG